MFECIEFFKEDTSCWFTWVCKSYRWKIFALSVQKIVLSQRTTFDKFLEKKLIFGNFGNFHTNLCKKNYNWLKVFREYNSYHIYRRLRLGFCNCGSPPKNNFFLILSIFESKIWHGFPHLEFSRRFLICFWSSTLGKCSNFHIYGLLNPSFAGNRTDLKSPNFLGNPAWALRLSKNYSLMVEMLLNCNNKVNFRWRQIKTYYMHSLK